MDIILKDKSGVTLHTAKKHCKEDITVRVETQEISITPSATEQVEEGLFNKVTVQGDANLVPENIKIGTNIFGVEGGFDAVDTRDADAIASDITKGKTAYVNNQKVTGTMEASYSSRLPSEYEQLEYIESTGTQYINTGVLPIASKHSAVINYTWVKLVKTREQWVFGQWYNNNGWRCGGSSNSYGTVTKDTSHGFNYTATGIGTKALGVSVDCPITSEYPMYLFAQQSNGNVEYLDSSFFKVYNCKIWESQNLIRDFIPCYRKTDGEVGMFDVVYNVFYTNQGTGTFVMGEKEKPYTYTKLKYIENTNADQYIDTGIKAGNKVGVELEVQTSEESQTNSIAFFGAYDNGGLLFGQHNGYHNEEEKGYYVATTGSWVYTGVPFDNTKFHKFIYDPINNKTTVDGVTVDVSLNPGNTYPLCLFRAYQWEEKGVGVRISSCKIYANGFLVRNLIPVKRDQDGVVCMYDLIENKYYLPSTGTFIAGEEI